MEEKKTCGDYWNFNKKAFCRLCLMIEEVLAGFVENIKRDWEGFEGCGAGWRAKLC